MQKIFNDHEKLKGQLEAQRVELESRGQELKTRETHNEMERKKLAEDLETVQHLFLLCFICSTRIFTNLFDCTLEIR